MKGRLIRTALVAATAVLLCAPAATLAQDPLLDEFAHCEDWYQEPDQPGSTLVACDQAQLDRFIASGLTDPGPGGARIDGPEGPKDPVPSVYWSEDPLGLRYTRVVGSGSVTGVYAAAFGTNGVMHHATFVPFVLPKDVRLRFRWTNAAATLTTSAGDVLATAPVDSWRGSPFHMLSRPKRVRAHRRGNKVAISWIGAPRERYDLLSGETRGSVSNRLVQTAAQRVVLRLPKGHRWIGVRALRGYRFSRIVRIRVR
ncbi:MAG TPA: hypothetical protein VF066_02515 [Thermoleophilaceae bacterium]